MPFDWKSPLRRRLVGSLGALLFLSLGSSTSTLSTESRPARSFSLGLDKALAGRVTLDLDLVAPAVSNLRSAGAIGALSTIPAAEPMVVRGEWHLRPSEASAATESPRSWRRARTLRPSAPSSSVAM